jgi:hypothetical protein
MATTLITVTGAEGLARLGRALKEAGRNDLRKELLRGVRRASKPMIPAARRAAAESLPHRGGLAADVAGAKWVVRTRLQGQGAGVRITGAWTSEGRQHDLSKMDSGLLRHPVWGHPVHGPGAVWVGQAIKPRWFSDAMQALAPEIRGELSKVIDEVSKKLEDSV